MLSFDNVTVRFGNGTVGLDGVTFEVEDGDFVIVEGPSGAGKTSLMRLVIRDLLPTSGLVLVDGDNVGKIPRRNLPLLRRKVGVVFQDFKLLKDRTVGENIDLALDILGLNKDLILKRRTELLELTSLSGKEDHFPVQLSGGELQRVAIARALAPQPKCLFADEPTGNLDAKTALSIIKLLQDINEQGTTVMMATHDLELVKDLHLRRIRLEHGQIAYDSGAKHHKKPAEPEKISDPESSESSSRP
jgi:cell division transport system ATP-binding protein